MEAATNDSSCNVSAPSSPKGCSLNNPICFYSVPTSPSRAAAASGVETEPATPGPEQYEDANSFLLDDFEFDTSHHFYLDDYKFETGQNFMQSFDHHHLQQQQQQRRQRQHRESLPAMAFADELFCDGKVMPLKPPPFYSSTLSSPSSPNSMLKLPFPRRSLWNDDFDPFVVALENVKKEQQRGKTRGNNHRRARSSSPLRPTDHTQSSPRKSMEINGSPIRTWVPKQNGQTGYQQAWKQAQTSPIKLTEPKGVLYARRARLVKMDPEKPSSKAASPRRILEAGGSRARETTRQRIMKFLIRSSYKGKTSNGEEQRDQSVEQPNPKITSKFSLSFNRPVGSAAQCNVEEKRVSEVNRMTVIRYRPRLLLCMGTGGKYVN